jgi:hypothetical protein
LARCKQAEIEYAEAEKKVAARKKLNARGKGTKRKRANGGNATKSTKRKRQSGKQNKTSARRGAQNVKFDLLDDDDHDDDNNDVGGNDDDGDNDDDTTNDEIDEDINGNYYIVNKDDPTYHHDDEESKSDSDSEPSMPPADFDTEAEDTLVENGKDLETSGRQGNYKNNSRDGDRRGMSTTTSHTATMSVQPIPVVRTQIAAAPISPDMDELIHIHGMSRSESLKCRQKFVTQRLNTFVKTDLFRKIKFVNSDTGLHGKGIATALQDSFRGRRQPWR